MIFLFYIIIITLILYSKGKMPVRQSKKERYNTWVIEHGHTVFKYTVRLLIIYTIVLIFMKINL
ncbi:hypothetical protein D3C87_112330 [compost metagenome]|jgi:hypothetical protein